MALSKGLYSFLGFYFEQLFEHPIRTKSVSASVIAMSANYTSQKLSGNKSIKTESLFAYGLYGLVFGGPLPHYFYKMIERITPDNRYKHVLEFLLERLAFTPVYVAVSLFFLSLFEGKNVDQCSSNLFKLYLPILKANWGFLSLPYFLNFTMVPPILRVLVMNFIGFCWVVYVANVRKNANKKKEIRDMASK